MDFCLVKSGDGDAVCAPDPSMQTHAQLMEWVKDLPPSPPPSWLGLSATSDHRLLMQKVRRGTAAAPRLCCRCVVVVLLLPCYRCQVVSVVISCCRCCDEVAWTAVFMLPSSYHAACWCLCVCLCVCLSVGVAVSVLAAQGLRSLSAVLLLHDADDEELAYEDADAPAAVSSKKHAGV